MAYGIVWDEAAVCGAARHIADDPEGLRLLLYAITTAPVAVVIKHVCRLG